MLNRTLRQNLIWDLIGVENLCDIGPDGVMRLNGDQTQTIRILRLPIHGKMYEVRAQPGRTERRLNGKIEAVATGVRHSLKMAIRTQAADWTKPWHYTL
jgi:hypothetical protein